MNNAVRDRGERATRRESGAILPFIAIGLLAIVGVAGMAIDSSHAFVNVTRVQNAVDAAALAAAKSLHIHDKDTTLASAHGGETFGDHLEGELSSSLQVSFEYSDTLSPFAAGGADPNYVRASVTTHTIPIWFASVLPGVGNQFTIAATAVSGPLPLGGGEVCDIAPLVVCAIDTTDTDSEDGSLYGLPMGDDAPISCLKQEFHDGGGGGGGGGGGTSDTPTSCAEDLGDPTLESGNFYLSRVNCPGGACVREALAGGYEGCTNLGGTLDTEPGNTVGPTAQGLNTRFNQYQGGGVNPVDHPPDLVTGSPMLYTGYKQAYAAEAWDNSIGEEERRILAVPIADCAGLQNGQSTVPVLSLGCYFLTQPVISAGGGSGSNSYILGQLVEGCESSGDTGPNQGPEDENGPYKIVLFDDPDNQGS